VPNPVTDSSRRRTLIFAGIVVASAAIYSFRLGADALGASEAYSAWAATKPTVGAIFRIPVLHDPGKQVFYYVVLHFFTRVFGSSEIALRSVSVAFAVASVVLVFALGRELFDEETAFAASLMWAFNPLAVVFAHRARMYSMFIAIALAQLWMLLRVRERGGIARAIGCGFAGAALLYTHLAGGLFIGAEVAMLAREYVRGRRNPMPWIAVAITLALFVPYVPVVRTQSATLIAGHWLDWIGARYEYPLAAKAIVLVAAGAIAAYCVLGATFEDSADEPYRWLCAWAILPALALGAGSILIRPMFNLRYVAPATAAGALVASAGVAAFSVKWRNLMAAGFALACLIMLPFDQPVPQPWRDFAREIVAEGSDSQPIFFEAGFVSSGAPNDGFPFGYYLIPFDYYFAGRNPRVAVPGFDPATARATIEARVSATGGGWLVSWKSADEAKSEMPERSRFATVEIFRGDRLALYRITPVAK
jgi:4-amino-4-deoxy-L-arabinose transferase-like glycosyltransferase